MTRAQVLLSLIGAVMRLLHRSQSISMRRIWLLFSQTVTVVLALWFIVATLQPEWLRGIRHHGAGITLLEAPAGSSAIRAAGSLSEAARKAMPAVVSINTRSARGPQALPQDPWFRFFHGEPDEQAPAGLGSGVIVSPQGHILTNNHVVEEADGIEVILMDGRKADARVIGTDPETDLALLKIELEALPVIVLGQMEPLQVGDIVLAIGNPFGVGQTVTSGIISALGRTQLGINTFENFIQTDAAINPGNSGGALIDVSGHLLGINTAIYSRSGGNMGIGFAIPVSTARQVMQDLLRDGKVIRGWIGVEPRPLNAEVAESVKLPSPNGSGPAHGVLIAGVLQNGPAARAGIRPGDVILQVQDKPVGSVPELLSQVAGLKPGNPARLSLWRGQGQLQVTVTPAERPVPKPR
jgi:serine protease DegQ